MPKPTEHCIFCGGEALTDEHIYAEWLKPYIPRTLENTTTYSSIVHQTRTEAKAYSRTGDPHSRRLRVACKRCNTGWMSQLQEHTKAILIPLVTGTPITLDAYAQRRVAAWAAMAIMVAEYDEPDKIAIPTEDRDYLRGHRDAPPNWKIWIGHYERGDWVGHWLHNVLPVVAKKDAARTQTNEIPAPNTQTTTFVVGQLYIHAISSSFPKVVDLFRFVGSASDKIACIWPGPDTAIDWPLRTLTDVEADRITNTFFNWALRSTGRDPI